MTRRNFGLSHIVPRDSSRATSPGLRARLLYSVKAAVQRLNHSLGKADRSAQAVHIQCIYMGRVLFAAHEGNTYSRLAQKSSPNQGDNR